jgi:hypothetical protein
VTDAGFTYVLSALTGAPFNEVFLPPSEAANPTVSGNAAYTDPNAIGLLTNASGSSFITSNAPGPASWCMRRTRPAPTVP